MTCTAASTGSLVLPPCLQLAPSRNYCCLMPPDQLNAADTVCSWPKYDKGQFQPPNVAREGYECGTHKEQAHLVAIAMRQWLINTSLPSEPRLAQRAPASS